MLVALSADMEGVPRLSDPVSILAFARSYWESGRQNMTNDVLETWNVFDEPIPTAPALGEEKLA